MRNAKKSFVSRADDELRELIKNGVTTNLNHLWQMARNSVTYTMDTTAEAFAVAMLSHEARKRGDSTYTAPAMPSTVKRSKEHEASCEEFVTAGFLNEQLKAGHGYGISIYTNGSLAMLNFADMNISKFKSLELLPLDIQSKLAMFKVIKENEAYTHLGCKFANDMYYIVAGDMNLDN